MHQQWQQHSSSNAVEHHHSLQGLPALSNYALTASMMIQRRLKQPTALTLRPLWRSPNTITLFSSLPVNSVTISSFFCRVIALRTYNIPS